MMDVIKLCILEMFVSDDQRDHFFDLMRMIPEEGERQLLSIVFQ